MSNQLKNCLLCHCLGDTLGFKNGEWEFYNKDSYNSIQNKLCEFLELGGINQISLKNWYASDDTIMHLTLLLCLKQKWKNMDELEKITKDEFIKLNDVFNNTKINRYPGNITMKYLSLLKRKDWHPFNFDDMAGGNGCSMRTLCIGIYFHNKLDNLIRYSINSSKMTHPNPIGWMGGLLSAYMAYCAVNHKPINEWLYFFVDMVNKKEISKKYIDSNEKDALSSFYLFMNKVENYINIKFNENHNVIEDKSNIILSNRILKYNNDFDNRHIRGQSGLSCCLIAYDCLIDAKDNFEQLIFYTIMNNYDTDTIACVAFGLYGILYGIKNIPDNLLKDLEFKDEINKICN